jgi:electron transport complex protein RnfC
MLLNYFKNLSFKREWLMFKRNVMSGGIFFKPDIGNTDPLSLPVENLPAPPIVTIPLIQNKETPARPIVKAGDYVAVGQIIGEATDDSGAHLHASVSGVVTKVSRYPYVRDPAAVSVTIENNGNDEFASPIPYDKPWTESGPDELIGKIRLSGIIDWNGGNGIPAHAKFAAAQGKRIDTLIINALATEPYCSADLRLCIDHSEKLAVGIAICKRITGASKCVVVAGGKIPKVLHGLSALPAGARPVEFYSVRIKKAKYPQHEEGFVVRACPGIVLPADCVVIGAAAAVAVRDAIVELIPSYQRAVTVAGPAIGSPKHLLVRIGTPVGCLLEACGADYTNIKKLVAGGPMSGTAVQDLETPVTKATGALLALDKTFPGQRQYPCFGCRRCYAVCPRRLEPSRLAQLVQADTVEELDKLGIMECIECGCCAYVCPSKINLVHYLSFGKWLVRERSAVRQRAG